MALGMALPNAAAHADATTSATTRTKTVSLHQTGYRAAGHSAAHPDIRSCITSSEAHWPAKGNVFGHFFYADAPAPCVGTAVIYLDFNKDICKEAIFSVTNSLGSRASAPRSHELCGSAGQILHTSFSVHKYWPGPYVTINARSTYTTKTTFKIGG